MFKHIKILAISMILIVGSIVAVYSIPRDVINQGSVGTDALGLTLDSDGALTGQVDNANDLGSSTYEFKDLYIDGTANIDTLAVDAATAASLAVTGDSALTGELDVDGALLESVTLLQLPQLTENTATLTAAQGGYVVVRASTAITLVLPAASGNTGLSYTVVNGSMTAYDLITVTLDGNASETINGSTTNNDMDEYYDVHEITCDGTEWYITGGNIQ